MAVNKFSNALGVCSISGPGLNYRLDNGIGYLAKTGFCNAGDCQKFPVVIGETGTTFIDVRYPLSHLQYQHRCCRKYYICFISQNNTGFSA